MKRDPLDRLRKANPVPLVPAVDRADLFERIVAQPRDTRPEHRPRPARRALVVAVVFAVAAILASAAYAISSWVDNGPVKPPVTRYEYKVAQHELTLPPGYTAWPSLHIDPNSVTGRGAGGGHAVLSAQNAWECYWVDAIESGDTAAQQRAHAELNALDVPQRPRRAGRGSRELDAAEPAEDAVRGNGGRRRLPVDAARLRPGRRGPSSEADRPLRGQQGLSRTARDEPANVR